MTLARYVQSPDETKNYLIDYSTWLDTGETLTNKGAVVSVVTVPPLVAATAIITALTGITLTVSGGLVDNDYIIKITATTTAGQVKEDCIDISVEAACG